MGCVAWAGGGPFALIRNMRMPRVALLALAAVAIGLSLQVLGTSFVLAGMFLTAALAVFLIATKQPTFALGLFVVTISVYYYLETILQYRFGLSAGTLSLLSRWQLLILFAVVATTFRASKREVILNPLDLLLVLFLLLTLLYVPTAPTPVAAAYALSNLLQFEAAYLAGRVAFRHVRRVAPFVLLLAIPLAIFGLLQPVLLGAQFYQSTASYVPPTYFQNAGSDLPRAMSLLGSPGYFGSFLMVVVSLAFARVLYASNKSASGGFALAAISLVLSAGALIATFHRSSWLGAAGACATVAFLSARRPQRLLLFAPLLVILLWIGSGTFGIIRVLQSALSQQDFSVGSHVDRAQEYVQLVLNSPLGTGLGNAGNAALFLGNPDAAGVEGGYSQVALQLGWLGLVVFVAIHAVAIILLLRNRFVSGDDAYRWVQIGAAGAIAGVALFNLFLPFQSFNPALMVLWLLVGCAVSSQRQTPGYIEASPVENQSHLLVPTSTL